MGVDLSGNNYELVRASWTAMDQTYGTVDPGFNLQPIDNSGHGNIQPWVTPPGYTVRAVIADDGLGGKFTVYKNDQTNTVLLNAIGTNGNSDAVGWYSNFKDFGLSQWRNEPEAGGSVKDRTFAALSDLVDSGTQVVVSGDSKGMALTGFIVNDLVTDRNSGVFAQNTATANLANLSNDRIAIVGRVGPGSEDILKKDDVNFDPNSQKFAGINVDYRAPRLADGSIADLVHQVGGDSINGNGQILYYSQGVTDNFSNPIDEYAYLHRLTNSGYDYLNATNGDFGGLSLSPRQTINDGELSSFGAFFASINQGSTVSTLEARTRLGTDFICAIATSPASALTAMLAGKLSTTNTIIGLGALALESTPLGRTILLGACALGTVAENGVKFLGDGTGGGLIASDKDSAFAVSSTGAPLVAPPGTTRAFGRTATGEMYVIDTGPNGSTSYIFGNNRHILQTVGSDSSFHLETNGLQWDVSSDQQTSIVHVNGGKGADVVTLSSDYVINLDPDTGSLVATKQDADTSDQYTLNSDGTWGRVVTQSNMVSSTTSFSGDRASTFSESTNSYNIADGALIDTTLLSRTNGGNFTQTVTTGDVNAAYNQNITSYDPNGIVIGTAVISRDIDKNGTIALDGSAPVT